MIKKGFLIGVLLFGIFFGAGNLIFPAELGFRAGENFYPAILGFVLSGVGIAIITLVLNVMVGWVVRFHMMMMQKESVSVHMIVR